MMARAIFKRVGGIRRSSSPRAWAAILLILLLASFAAGAQARQSRDSFTHCARLTG